MNQTVAGRSVRYAPVTVITSPVKLLNGDGMATASEGFTVIVTVLIP